MNSLLNLNFYVITTTVKVVFYSQIGEILLFMHEVADFSLSLSVEHIGIG